MSYINEALQKAQKENDSNYAAYGNMISASAEKEQRPAKGRLFVYFLILSGLLVMVFLLSGQLEKKEPAQPIEPAKAKSEATVRPEKKPEIIDPDVLFARAVKKQNAGKLMEAKELYRKIIKTNPRNVQAFNNLGVVYMKRKNYKWAVIRFNDALALQPNYVDAHYNLACLYSQKKDFARSFQYLKSAVELNPEARKWAKKDSDLRELRRFPDFNNLLEEQEY